MTKRLWDTDHPYMMTLGNYYATDCHQSFETWSDFIDEWGGSDQDYNWVVRWDWVEAKEEDPDCREDGDPEPYSGDDDALIGEMRIQVILQRKASLSSCSVKVCRNDEPKVREYLAPYFAYMMQMWDPFAPVEPAHG